MFSNKNLPILKTSTKDLLKFLYNFYLIFYYKVNIKGSDHGTSKKTHLKIN